MSKTSGKITYPSTQEESYSISAGHSTRKFKINTSAGLKSQDELDKFFNYTNRHQIMAINENDVSQNFSQVEKRNSKLSRNYGLLTGLNEEENEGTPIASLPVSPIGSDIAVDIPKPGTAIINIQTEPSKLDIQHRHPEMSKTGFRNQALQLGSLNDRSRRQP